MAHERSPETDAAMELSAEVSDFLKEMREERFVPFGKEEGGLRDLRARWEGMGNEERAKIVQQHGSMKVAQMLYGKGGRNAR